MANKAKYEFNEEEEGVFKSLSNNMTIVVLLIGAAGIATIIIFAVGPLLPFTLNQLLLLIEGILYCVMAVAFYFPIDNFKRIVTTKGRDIDELMTGLKEFDKGVLVVIFLTLANVIVFLIIMINNLLAIP
jgi:hypothetical protein